MQGIFPWLITAQVLVEERSGAPLEKTFSLTKIRRCLQSNLIKGLQKTKLFEHAYAPG